jgi:hypothetical protein
MQDNRNTDNQTQHEMVEPEEWAIAFEPYEHDPYAALKLAINLATLRTELDSLLIKSRPTLEALDDALEILFPYTTFHDASLDLFLKFTEGKLTFDEEQMLNALGVKF